MSDTDIDSGNHSDEDISESHSKLIEAISELDKGQRVKKPERTEPTLEVSEFHLVKSAIADKDVVSLQNLAKSLGTKGHQTEISKKLFSTQRNAKVLSKPLEKPTADRLKRTVGFEKIQKDLEKWNGIITRNRTAEKIYFPLNQSVPKLKSSTEIVKKYRLQSNLEKELAALEPPPKETEEKEDVVQMTLEEVMERRKEAAKLRALQSYKEAKAHRQRRIKSKKFHRIQKKEMIKQQLKEFEKLQKTNPQAALEKLMELDKTRAEERMSLRHKSTGQWAKNKQIRAKYNKETRQVLAQQLSIGRDLTQKVQMKNDSEDENDVNVTPLRLSNDKENPWLCGVKTEAEINDFVQSYRKYWDKKNNEEEIIEKNPTVVSNGSELSNDIVETGATTVLKTKSLNNIVATSTWDVQPVVLDTRNDIKLPKTQKISEIFDFVDDKLQEKINLKLQSIKRKYNIESITDNSNVKKKCNVDDEPYSKKLEFKAKKQKPILNEPMNEIPVQELSTEKTLTEVNNLANSIDKINSALKKTDDINIDPNKYINVKSKKIKTHVPDVISGGDDALDDSEDEKEKHDIISEAFADDNVVEEFRKEKEDEVKQSQPEDIDLSLPGWGAWGGKNIQQPRKKKRLILKFPKDAPRKDMNKGDVIIIEENDAKIRQHQVSELPFPFETVKDFEASIRAPLGRTFIPETAHERLVTPVVKTALGKIIEPMSEDILVDTSKFQKKKRKAAVETNKRKTKFEKGMNSEIKNQKRKKKWRNR